MTNVRNVSLRLWSGCEQQMVSVQMHEVERYLIINTVSTSIVFLCTAEQPGTGYRNP